MDCNQVIKACDKALESKNKVIKLADLAIKEAQDNNNRLNDLVETKNQQLGSIWRNPIFLIMLGLVGGLIIKR